MLEWLYKLIFNGEALHNAITQQSKSIFQTIIKLDSFDPNAVRWQRRGDPPLERAIYRPYYAFELLEKGADPNIVVKDVFTELPIPLVRSALLGHKLNVAKLLVLYGADINNPIIFSPRAYPANVINPIIFQPETKLILAQYHEIYEKIHALSQIHTAEAYTTLAEIWLELSAKETDKELKECYLNKSKHYADKLVKIDQLMPTKQQHKSDAKTVADVGFLRNRHHYQRLHESQPDVPLDSPSSPQPHASSGRRG